METEINSKAMQVFNEATGSLMNPYIQTWLEDGGKVAGYLCSSVPEELLMAAGYPAVNGCHSPGKPL